MSQAAAIPTPSAARSVFSPRTVLWMILAGVFSFSAFVVLSTYEPDLAGGMDGGGHALSRSAVGFAGLVRLLRAEGVPVEVARTAVSKQTVGLYVLTPPASTGPQDVRVLSAAGPTLIVLPKWDAMPDPTTDGWVRPMGLTDASQIEKMLSARLGAVKIGRRADRLSVSFQETGESVPRPIPGSGPIDQLQTIAAPGLDPILTDAAGEAVVEATHDGRTYVLSDPDLLNTHGLADLATAQAASALVERLRQADGPIVFDVTLNGLGRSRSLLKLAFEPPFVGATLCLVAAALLMALHAASRFGAPRPASRALAFGKRALADNAAALIRLAKREPRMAVRYLDQSRAAVVKALGAQRQGGIGLSGDDLDIFLDRVAERGGVHGRLSVLRPAARAVKTREALLTFAAETHAWRLEMTRERR